MRRRSPLCFPGCAWYSNTVKRACPNTVRFAGISIAKAQCHRSQDKEHLVRRMGVHSPEGAARIDTRLKDDLLLPSCQGPHNVSLAPAAAAPPHAPAAFNPLLPPAWRDSQQADQAGATVTALIAPVGHAASALVAALRDSLQAQPGMCCALHAVRRDVAASRDPVAMLGSMMRQLAERLPACAGVHAHLSAQLCQASPSNDGSALWAVMRDHQLNAEGCGRVVLVIDALHDADAAPGPVTLPARHNHRSDERSERAGTDVRVRPVPVMGNRILTLLCEALPRAHGNVLCVVTLQEGRADAALAALAAAFAGRFSAVRLADVVGINSGADSLLAQLRGRLGNGVTGLPRDVLGSGGDVCDLYERVFAAKQPDETAQDALSVLATAWEPPLVATMHVRVYCALW